MRFIRLIFPAVYSVCSTVSLVAVVAAELVVVLIYISDPVCDLVPHYVVGFGRIWGFVFCLVGRLSFYSLRYCRIVVLQSHQDFLWSVFIKVQRYSSLLGGMYK